MADDEKTSAPLRRRIARNGIRVVAGLARGAAVRVQLEKEAQKKAEASKDEATIALFKRRSELDKKVATLQTAPAPRFEPLSPMTPALRAAKAICDKHGARLLVVALPIDVQVSPAEWAKYGAAPLDMEPTKVLLEDVVVAARAVGAEGLDATPALAAAEPGAFLHGDLHMTPKGHHALGEAIAKALRTPRVEAPRAAPVLPPGRSYPPASEEWTKELEIAVRESEPAGCETKRAREWVGIFCRQRGGAKGVTVTSGTEVLAGTVPGGSFLVAPALYGQDVRATFVFEGATRTLIIKAPDGPHDALIEFSKPLPAAAASPAAEGTDAFCTCVGAKTPGLKCSSANVVPDSDCARTYAGDCAKLLACASGQPASPPTCAAGFVNAGVAGRCHAACSNEVACKVGTCTDWQGDRACM